VAHPGHQVPEPRAASGREMVTRVPKIMEMQARQADQGGAASRRRARRQRRRSALGGPRGARRATPQVGQQISTPCSGRKQGTLSGPAVAAIALVVTAALAVVGWMVSPVSGATSDPPKHTDQLLTRDLPSSWPRQQTAAQLRVRPRTGGCHKRRHAARLTWPSRACRRLRKGVRGRASCGCAAAASYVAQLSPL